MGVYIFLFIIYMSVSILSTYNYFLMLHASSLISNERNIYQKKCCFMFNFNFFSLKNIFNKPISVLAIASFFIIIKTRSFHFSFDGKLKIKVNFLILKILLNIFILWIHFNLFCLKTFFWNIMIF